MQSKKTAKYKKKTISNINNQTNQTITLKQSNTTGGRRDRAFSSILLLLLLLLLLLFADASAVSLCAGCYMHALLTLLFSPTACQR
ncbi:hypothetical protein BC939DRAFT_48532 [Gamsiella multidivaricata]|uniref:uncharacterized protein n=1 Tax=Gamsiella multidivaricata TaxID=101098 RepID=UPI0022202713|nr:uncharacterized protein BC939DRAFT_48532 [Gamsiella multidivaricata]KAI7828712.1 hypothetical protein BC939DRAFT_48532 [Gamsiella multidivaricata]